MRILFLCKKNEIYGFKSYCRRSSGLFYSTEFIARSLNRRGVNAKIVEVTDNNDIDREVSDYRPDVCVIEALWVVPEKFDVLQQLHPRVKWFTHLHSQMAFLALEGISMGWIKGYDERGVGVIANSEHSYSALSVIMDPDNLTFLPNVYSRRMRSVKSFNFNSTFLDVGCFGALRPLKNHLAQALAAMEFARQQGLVLRFYINSTRVETGGDPVLKCLRELFENDDDASLIEIDWQEPDQLLSLMEKMDIGMQVSLSETFNVVTADYITAGIPIVVSDEVEWVSSWSQADEEDVQDMVSVMGRALGNRFLVKWNQWLLKRHGAQAAQMWFDWACSLQSP